MISPQGCIYILMLSSSRSVEHGLNTPFWYIQSASLFILPLDVLPAVFVLSSTHCGWVPDTLRSGELMSPLFSDWCWYLKQAFSSKCHIDHACTPCQGSKQMFLKTWLNAQNKSVDNWFLSIVLSTASLSVSVSCFMLLINIDYFELVKPPFSPLSGPHRCPVYRIWLYKWDKGLCWTTRSQVFAGLGGWQTIDPDKTDTTWVCRNTAGTPTRWGLL